MKKVHLYSAFLALSVVLSSCGFNSAFISNHNQNATQVQLTSNNFKVVDQVSGSAEVRYILGFGGLKQKRLYENAYADMVKKANLLNSSKALINVMTEEHYGGFAPIVYTRTVTVSAQVVEFTK